uniref:Uncharacterized protein n=1 Tax=Moniliophthora roreri TaxID=221103 RepID=A0A0W0F6J0_MONRR
MSRKGVWILDAPPLSKYSKPTVILNPSCHATPATCYSEWEMLQSFGLKAQSCARLEVDWDWDHGVDLRMKMDCSGLD